MFLNFMSRMPIVNLKTIAYGYGTDSIIGAVFYLSAVFLLIFALVSTIRLFLGKGARISMIMFFIMTGVYCWSYYYFFTYVPSIQITI